MWNSHTSLEFNPTYKQRRKMKENPLKHSILQSYELNDMNEIISVLK